MGNNMPVFYFQIAQFVLPNLPGAPLSSGGILGILTNLANFLIAAGITVAIIAIVISGIMYFKAGSDTKAESAKSWFRNGVIGAFIILAVGVIINTIALVVTGGFFGGAPGGGLGTGGSVRGTIQGVEVGGSCTGDAGCPAGSLCNAATGICRRNEGNVSGETCGGDIDCATGLQCEGSGIFGLGQKTCQ